METGQAPTAIPLDLDEETTLSFRSTGGKHFRNLRPNSPAVVERRQLASFAPPALLYERLPNYELTELLTQPTLRPSH